MNNKQIKIIFENDNLLVINKPAGVVVNRAKTHNEETIQDWFTDYLGRDFFSESFIKKGRKHWEFLVPHDFADQYGTPEEIWLKRQGMVHRLDKDTSGALLLAKNPGALVNLLAQFKQKQVAKEYLALCHGRFVLDTGKINAPLSRARKNRLRFAVSATGKKAETHYELIERYWNFDWEALKNKILKDNRVISDKQQSKILKRGPQLYQAGFTLVKAKPKTGRTHQIRVHFASMQHPLVADKIYSGRKRQTLDQLWCPRHFLHAARVEFFLPTGPVWQKKQLVEVPLTADLQLALSLLK
jgi:23S rRNA pseudouridine1911/1915/1917 synthase